MSELIFADIYSSFGSSGEVYQGKTETSGLVTEFSTKDVGVVKKAAEDMKFDNNNVLIRDIQTKVVHLEELVEENLMS